METMTEVGSRLGGAAVELRRTLLRTVGRAREGMRKDKRVKIVRRANIFWWRRMLWSGLELVMGMRGCEGDSWITSIIFLRYCPIRIDESLTMVRSSLVSSHVRGHRKDCWQIFLWWGLTPLSSDIDSAGLEGPLRFAILHPHSSRYISISTSDTFDLLLLSFLSQCRIFSFLILILWYMPWRS